MYKRQELNFPGDTRHAAYAEDAFKYLDRMGDQYDLIVPFLLLTLKKEQQAIMYFLT